MKALVLPALVSLFFASAPALAEESIAVYPHLMNPRVYPDDARRAVKPPSWETFGNQPQFTSLRGFPMDGNRLVHFEEEIDKYVGHDLGRVLWPSYPTVFADNIGDLADAAARRGLFIFDIWGYVPGSGPGDYWKQFVVPRAALDTLESKLGERWLGMDVGEQDGRYIGGYASQLAPMSPSRVDQYLNFQRHFERMGDDLGQKLSTLVSLNYGHYFLKEGTFTAIGAETAQALPNSQVYYAFIRGAGKQYGVPWFGNASVFNRWGYKAYGAPGPDHSPTKGTSLNLLKRLIYSHLLYNCVFAGFESGLFDGESLSPIGRIQQAAQQWVNAHGQPGVQHTPVALLLDFYSGWTFPRHLYSERLYRVWGNIPFAEGDYWTDALLDMFYPGYQNASYYHDETGFLSPTPFGDSAEVLLSDAPGWVLAQYPVLVLAGELNASQELADTLTAYVEQGGHLVLTAGNLAKFTEGLLGAAVQSGGSQALHLPKGAEVLEKDGDTPLAARWTQGAGKVTLFSSAFGVARDSAVQAPIKSANDQPLPKPYTLLPKVRQQLEAVFRSVMLFDAGPDLSLIACRKALGVYTLYVSNNRLEPRPLKIESRCGTLLKLEELPLDTSEKGAVGFLPEGLEQAAVGVSSADTIAGGDVRLFEARVQETRVVEKPAMKPAPVPHGVALPLGQPAQLKEAILRKPTFFQHFDSALVDWRYLRDRDPEALRREAGWLQRQGLRLYIDATSDINLYPGLRLTQNDPDAFAASMREWDALLEKMPLINARDLLVCLHRQPENSFTWQQTWDSFRDTLRELAARAKTKDITVYLAVTLKSEQGIDKVSALVSEIGSANLRLAPSAALLLRQGHSAQSLPPQVAPQIGLWLASAPETDFNGAVWTLQRPLATLPDPAAWNALRAAAPDAPVALYAVYENTDEEYRDAQIVAGR